MAFVGGTPLTVTLGGWFRWAFCLGVSSSAWMVARHLVAKVGFVSNNAGGRSALIAKASVAGLGCGVVAAPNIGMAACVYPACGASGFCWFGRGVPQPG